MSLKANEVAPKEIAPKPVDKNKGKVEAADTYLGLASKILTIVAALSTLLFWAYSNYYVGGIEVRPDKQIDSITVKLYDERGMESVFHTDRMKVAPGRYQVVIESGENVPAKTGTHVRFNATTVVPYAVQEQVQTPVIEPAPVENRRWWQFWKRN